MSISSNELLSRSNESCELCTSKEGIDEHVVSPKTGDDINEIIVVCQTCKAQIEEPDSMDPNHWRCLNDSMWSEVPAVQIMAYRILHLLHKEDWTQDLINMMYLSEENMEWAQADLQTEGGIVHKDSNGNILSAGDTVVLIKDLNVKGANFTAKRGTAVRRISLDRDNPNHIEGKVNDQHIVILTQYVKKS